MNRKQKIDLIRAGIKPDKIHRYSLNALEKEDGTFDVWGFDFISKTTIKGIYTKEELHQLESGDERYYSISFHICIVDPKATPIKQL